MKVARHLKIKIRFSFGALVGSALAYWLTRLFLRRPDAFGGEVPHPWERALGPAHLVAALCFIFVLGIVWAQHAGVAARAGRHRRSGWIFFILIGGLAVSGVAMLYGSEPLIHRAAQIHPWLGVLLLPVLVFHWLRASR